MHLATIRFINLYKGIQVFISAAVSITILISELTIRYGATQIDIIKKASVIGILALLIPPLLAMISGLASNKDEVRECILKTKKGENQTFKRAYTAKLLRKINITKTTELSIGAVAALIVSVIAFKNNEWYAVTTTLTASICALILTELMEHIDYASAIGGRFFTNLCIRAVKEFSDENMCKDMEEEIFTDYLRDRNEKSN